MGRSRGGLTTKIHALVDRKGRPIALKLTPGQAHDGKSAADMLASLKKGQTLLADAAYDSDALREDLRQRGVKGEIKPMPGRVVALRLNKRAYKKRNAVERFFNKMKHYRAVATRYEKHANNFLALVKLAAVQIWIRSYESVT